LRYAGEAVEFLASCDVVISFKLHAAVLAFVCNVPIIVLSYSSKCNDFAESIGWKRYIARPEGLTGESVIDMLSEIRCVHHTLSANISEAMLSLKHRFMEYCRFLDSRMAET
jgi:polysaccharide pyruvyl transferase WcaK-like protein